MRELYAHVAGARATSVRLTVPNVGPWWADVDFEDAAPGVAGRVVLSLGALDLHGTVTPSHDGTNALQRRCQIVAGGGGWGALIAGKHYHNDAGVKARIVAEDAARAVGETIGTCTPAAERIGVDYVREAGPASRALEDVIGDVPWWVDYDGVTRIGPRPATPAVSGGYQVLEYDARERVAQVVVDGGDLRAVAIGSILSDRLDAPQTVRELELRITGDDQTLRVWCGGGDTQRSRLAQLFAASVARVTDAALWGKYRYRVVRMAGDRVELQAVSKRFGLPDVLPVSMWPGVAGAHAQLTPGAEVLVEFIAGERTAPIVTHFAGKDGQGFAPVLLTLGGPTGTPAARSGDAVEVLLPPAVFSGTISGAPATGVLTFPSMRAIGTITAGSSKVAVAS